MPKVRAPLFSASASGTLARLLTYENRPDNQRVRRLPRYSPPHTPAQTTTTNKVSAMAASWSGWDDAHRLAWTVRAEDYELSGYALYWREWFAQGIDAPARPELP